MDDEHLLSVFIRLEGKVIQDIKHFTIISGEGQHEEIKVAIDIRDKKKPFLGGFRHKVTGAQYHNASAQTNPKPLRWPKTTLYNRDAQVFCVFYVYEKVHFSVRSFFYYILYLFIPLIISYKFATS